MESPAQSFSTKTDDYMIGLEVTVLSDMRDSGAAVDVWVPGQFEKRLICLERIFNTSYITPFDASCGRNRLQLAVKCCGFFASSSGLKGLFGIFERCGLAERMPLHSPSFATSASACDTRHAPVKEFKRKYFV